MPRAPYAMKTLVKQVSERREDAQAEYGDADGLGVYRTVTFDDSTSGWLADLSAVFLDPRVASSSLSDDGSLTVTFVPDIRADQANDFPLDAVAAVNEAVDAEEEEIDPEVAERDVREQELKDNPVSWLREQYPDYADLKKNEIVEAVLASEFD